MGKSPKGLRQPTALDPERLGGVADVKLLTPEADQVLAEMAVVATAHG